MLRAYLKQYGLDPDRDVRLVAIADSAALIAGIQQGRFDAIASASGVVEQAIGLKAGSMWFSAAHGDVPGSAAAMICVVVARADTLEKNKAEVEAYVAALKDALDAIHSDHARTGANLKAQYFAKLDPALWDLIWNGATDAYPPSLIFTKEAFDYWLANDPKGAGSFKNVDYRKITWGPAQSP